MPERASPDQTSAQCPRCGKLLLKYSCPNCSGKGYVYEFLFLKKTSCNSCNGSGISFGCPDEIMHRLMDRLKHSTGKGGAKNSNSGNYHELNIPKTTNKETSDICPHCGGRGSKQETSTINEWEPDRTVTTYEPEYVPGKMGEPGRYVTKPKTTRIPGRLITNTKMEHVTCPFCGGSGKKL